MSYCIGSQEFQTSCDADLVCMGLVETFLVRLPLGHPQGHSISFPACCLPLTSSTYALHSAEKGTNGTCDTKKVSAAEVQSAEAREKGCVVAGDKASRAQKEAAKTVSDVVAAEAAENKGEVPKGGKASKAQSAAAQEQRFPTTDG